MRKHRTERKTIQKGHSYSETANPAMPAMLPQRRLVSLATRRTVIPSIKRTQATISNRHRTDRSGAALAHVETRDADFALGLTL